MVFKPRLLRTNSRIFGLRPEIVAERLKGTERVPSTCSGCQENCGSHPTHWRYSSEAIKQLPQRAHPDNVDEIFDALQRIRHTLMHGGASNRSWTMQRAASCQQAYLY
jgi:hypothetical protein